MQNGIVRGLLSLLGATLLLSAIIGLGQWARYRLRDQERYRFAFTDIDCSPPASLSRREFLDEVQDLADEPEGLSLLDDHLPERLSQVFLRHPWVEAVERVEVSAT